MRKLPLFAIAFFLLVGCGSRQTETRDEQESWYSGFEEESGGEIEMPVSSGRAPYANPIGRYDEVFNDSNYVQYASAEKLGISPIYGLNEAYYTRRPLVKVESGEHYQIDRLTHSMPYLVPEAAELLEEIGRDFGNVVRERGGDPTVNKILVTSLLRSAYSVKKLRSVNKNAVDSSTHMFATTFDLSWNNFHSPDASRAIDAGVLKGILAEVLLKKRNEGKCWVKYEKKSPCFHITVNDGSPAPPPPPPAPAKEE